MEEKNNQTNEEKVNPPQEKKSKKNLIPWVSNDDLILIVSGIILVVGTFNIEKIYSLFSKNKFELEYSETNNNINEENNEENIGKEENNEEENKEKTLSCTIKNDENDYVLDINYVIKYNEKVYQMTYGIEVVDLKSLNLEESKLEERKDILDDELLSYENYLEYAENLEGSKLTKFQDGNFVQIIDFSKTDKNKINGSDKEVIFFNLDDTFENIKKSFEKNGYTCE